MISNWLSAALARRNIHYGWAMVGVTFLTTLISAGTVGAPGVFIVPLQNEFGWSTAEISSALSIRFILFGLMAPFAAALLNRYGLRNVTLTAQLIVVSALVLSLGMSEVWQLVALWGVVIGIGTGMTALVLGATIATRWFAARRGLVVGILSGGASTGQLLFLPVMANITAAYGWRTTVLSIAAVVCVVLPLVALILRDRPSDVGLMPYGETGEPKPAVAPKGNPIMMAFTALGEAVHYKDFWLLAGTYFVCGASTNGLIGTHLIPACIDHGFTEVTGAALLATMGVFNFVGTTSSGWLADKFDNRWLLFTYYALRGLSLIYLPFSFVDFYTMTLFAMFYGLDWFATVSPTVRMLGNTFGREKASLVYGWVFAAHQLGGASAAFFAGLLREGFGDYMQAFMLSGILCLLAAIAALFIGGGRQAQQPVVTATA